MSFINEVVIDGYPFNIGRLPIMKTKIPMQIILDLDDEKTITALKTGDDSLLKALFKAYEFSDELDCINSFKHFEHHITQGTKDWARYAYDMPYKHLEEYKRRALIAVSSEFADENCKIEAQRFLDFLNGNIPEYEPSKFDLLRRKEEKFRRARSKWLKLLIERDGYKCNKCHTEKDLCVKHTISLSKGGETELDNLKLVCRSCMRKK